MMVWVGRNLRVILTAGAGVLLAVLLFLASQRYAHPVCVAPSVPIQELDARLSDIGCATIGPYRTYHGVWVDAMDSSWFHLNATAAPRAQDLAKTDGWLFLNAQERDALYKQLPEVANHERVRDQVIAVSFEGTEYRIDQRNKYNLHRFYDIGTIRSARLLRRDFVSNRIKE
jgi:hypothetical protein